MSIRSTPDSSGRLVIYLGGTITAEADMTAEITRRTVAAWSVFRRITNVVYDSPTAILPLALKV